MKEDVVKLVDYIDTITWVNLTDLKQATATAQIETTKKRQILTIDGKAKAIYEVEYIAKYVIVRSDCKTSRSHFEVVYNVNETLIAPSFLSCNNDTWLFESPVTADHGTELVIRNNGAKRIHISKIGVGMYSQEKTLGVLHEDGKQRLGQLRASYTEPQILVAVLGLRGSGKSTVASLVSGHDEMFKQGRRSTRTTTLGIDISPIIPLADYMSVLGKNLNKEYRVTNPPNAAVLFTDSEGTGVRGKQVDFIATLPPLLLSNLIFWITTEAIRADEELLKLNRYLNLADKIQDDSGTLCTDFKAGKLVVIVNKMQGQETDEELTDELLDEELETEESTAVKRNHIRKQLRQCFSSVEVVGLPHLHLPANVTSITHIILQSYDEDGRFMDGLRKLGELIIGSRNDQRILAGIKIIPKDLETILDFILDKINNDADFLDNDLRDALYFVTIKQKLGEYEVLSNERMVVAERNNGVALEGFIFDILRSIEDNKRFKKSLLAEISGKRQNLIFEKEWSILESRLEQSIRKLVSHIVNVDKDDIKKSLIQYWTACEHVPAMGQRCVKNYFQSKLSSAVEQVLQIPFIDATSEIFMSLNDSIRKAPLTLKECEAKRSFSQYGELAKAQSSIATAIELVELLRSGKADVASASASFENLLSLSFPAVSVSVPTSIPCNFGSLLKKNSMLPKYILRSFRDGLNIFRIRKIYFSRSSPLDIPFDFLNVVEKSVSNGKRIRIISQNCDIPSILGTIPAGVEEIKLICFFATVYGFSTTDARVLQIEAADLQVKGEAKITLSKPSTPTKAESASVGTAGLPGGSVYVKVHDRVQGGVLGIVADGGDGGEGGNGLRGVQGNTGRSGTIPAHFYSESHYGSLPNNQLSQVGYHQETCERWRGHISKWLGRRETYTCRKTWQFRKHDIHRSVGAEAGGKGMSGSRGGNGGAGGVPGGLTIEVPKHFQANFILSARGGKGGAGGIGGSGGPGGSGGESKILEVTYNRVWEWRENHHDKMLSQSMATGESFAGKEGDGSWGDMGASGSPGSGNLKQNAVQFGSLEKHPLYAAFEEVQHLEKKGPTEKRYMGERIIPRLLTYVDSLLQFFLQQKRILSNLKAMYITQITPASLDSILKAEAELANQLILAHKTEQEAIALDSDAYESALKRIDEDIGKFDTGSFKHYIDRLKDKLMSDARNDLSSGIQEIEEDKKNSRLTLSSVFSKVFAVVNIASGVMGNYPGAAAGLMEIFSSAKSFVNTAAKLDFDGLKNVYRNITNNLQEVKGVAESAVVDVDTVNEPRVSARSTSEIDVVFENYFAAIEQAFQTGESLGKTVAEFIDTIGDTGIREQISLGVKIRDLMESYSPVALAGNAIEVRFQRHEVRQLLSQMKSVFLEFASITGSSNYPEIDNLMSLIDMKVEFAEKLIETMKDMSRIQQVVSGLTKRVKAMTDASKSVTGNIAAAHDTLDEIMAQGVLNLLNTGSEIHSGVWDLVGIATHIRQNNKFLEKMPTVLPWSSEQSFSTSLQLLKNEFGNWRGLQEGTVEITLDEIDFPHEFYLLRTKRKARFPLLANEKDQLWIETVKVTMSNVSEAGQYFTVLTRHLGSRLFDFGGDLKLLPIQFESTYELPGPVWKSVPKSVYNTVELVNYPLESYFEIEIPDNYHTLNVVSNTMLDMENVNQLNLEFKVWYEQ